MLAEIPNWNVFGAVAGCFLFVLIFVEKLQSVMGVRKQRREVTFPEEFVSKPEFNHLKADVSKVNADLLSLKESIVVNGEIRRKNIEAKVESVRVELKGDIENIRREIKEDGLDQQERMTQLINTTGEMRGEIRQALKDR